MDKPPRTIYREGVKELFEGQCEANCRIFLVCTLHASTSNLLCVISETTKQKFGDSIDMGFVIATQFLTHLRHLYTAHAYACAYCSGKMHLKYTRCVTHIHTRSNLQVCSIEAQAHFFFFIFSPPKIVFTRTYMTHVCYRANLLLFTFFFCPIFTVWS